MEHIDKATTLDKRFYIDDEIWQASKQDLFASAWLYLGDAVLMLRDTANLHPIVLLDRFLDEHLLVVSQDDELSCMSNICTHRAYPLIHHPTKSKKIVCGYHGRRFNLEGKVEHMPMFQEVKDFPRPCDHLAQVPMRRWQRWLFTGLEAKEDFEKVTNVLDERLYHMDMSSWRYAPEYSKSYAVKAHWALYADNYLEGFHIPFVHEGLTQILDFSNYHTETKGEVVLQIGYGKSGDPLMQFPEGHPDFDKKVTAYYYWIFPNFMLNIYNWGVQINIIRPVSKEFCKVDFEYYISDEQAWEQFGKDGLAEKTEREDEYIVEAVQRGLHSRYYNDGQYSPNMENGVYAFHQMVRERMKNYNL